MHARGVVCNHTQCIKSGIVEVAYCSRCRTPELVLPMKAEAWSYQNKDDRRYHHSSDNDAVKKKNKNNKKSDVILVLQRVILFN